MCLYARVMRYRRWHHAQNFRRPHRGYNVDLFIPLRRQHKNFKITNPEKSHNTNTQKFHKQARLGRQQGEMRGSATTQFEVSKTLRRDQRLARYPIGTATISPVRSGDPKFT